MRSQTILVIFVLAALAAPASEPTPAPETDDGAALTYVANGGYLVADGDTKVLVDALFREGIAPYVAPAVDTRALAEGALGPFAGVDVVLVSHYHADHYDPEAVLAHLRSNPDAVFVSTRQAVDAMRGMDGYGEARDRIHAVAPAEGEAERIEHGGVTVDVLNLHHGRDRPIQNNGYVFTVGSSTYLHMGDTEATASDLAAYDLPSRGIDVALVPYWFLESAAGRTAIRDAIDPGRIVATHVPGPSSQFDWVPDEADWEAWVDRIEASMDGVEVLRQPGETR